MDDLSYIEHQDRKLQEHENLCKRCGACCGVKDNDPCEHLMEEGFEKYSCNIYNDRFGLRKTISGKEFLCVPLRNILHRAWWGRSGCAYAKDYKTVIEI